MHSRERSSSLPVSTAAMAKHPSNGVAGGPAVWPDHGVAEAGGLASRQRPRGAHFHPSKQACRGSGIWRREGLKVPQKQKPRGRLWLKDGSCVRLRSERRNHVWSYDFITAGTHDGRSVGLPNRIEEHRRESLLVRAERRWSSARIISALVDVMGMKGVPEQLRSDNGPEFVAKDLRNGWPRQEQKRCISSRDLRGRTGTAKASTPSFGTSSLMVRSSPR